MRRPDKIRLLPPPPSSRSDFRGRGRSLEGGGGGACFVIGSFDGRRSRRRFGGKHVNDEPRCAALWDAEAQSLIDWYRSARAHFPRTAFVLSPGVRISEPDRFFAMLDLDIACGPDGPRGTRRVLLLELQRLRGLFSRGSPAANRTRVRKLALGMAAAEV
jgi:hypothetical protein